MATSDRLTDDPTDDKYALPTIVCKSLQYDRLPDYAVFSAAAWAIEDSIGRVAEVGR